MNVDKSARGTQMYDLIASWMTSGGPLQELRRDDRGRIPSARADIAPATEPERHSHRPSLAFARGLRPTRSPMTSPCIDGCAAC
jgi:hypothetical protein